MAGRPTLYREKYCEDVIEWMAQGFSFESFAGKIGVSVETLYEWTRRHPPFSEAKKIAFAKCSVYWEKAGREGLWGDKNNVFNSSVWIFNMKNRFKWKDRVEHSGDENKPIKIAYNPDE